MIIMSQIHKETFLSDFSVFLLMEMYYHSVSDPERTLMFDHNEQ